MDQWFEGGGEVGALMRAFDWTRTSLGPPHTWPQSLRTIVRVMLTSRYSMWLGWGPDLAFLYNDAYAHDTLGAKHPWALGRPAREVWAEIWDAAYARIQRVLEHGESTWDEDLLLFLERNGYPEETYHTFSYSPIPDDSGAIAGNFCVVTEGTERVIGARRLALLRDLAARLAPATTESDVFAAVQACLATDPRDIPCSALYLFDTDGVKARLAVSTGFAGDDPVPREVDLTQPDAPWGLRAIANGEPMIMIDCAADGPLCLPCGPWQRPPRHGLVLPLAQPGQSSPAGAFVAGLNPHRPLNDGYRSFAALLVGQIGAGLASARAYEEERRRAEALASLDRAKTAFFSNVSHEFRTPLTLMLGPTQDALATGTPMRRDELETVYRNQLRLLKLVNSLLDFSRIEAGRTRATYEPVDLSSLTADLASTFRSAIERGGLTFDVDCPPLPEPIYVDRSMWEKIVLNLLSNAFKFTFDGRIGVAMRWEGRGAVLTVDDTGAGIAAHELSRVFERFHRIEGTRARTHEGSGIGLALVHDLVALHGGGITVRSEPGRGTTFTVTIPGGRGHLDPDRVASAAAPAPAPSGAQAFVVEAERWLDGEWVPPVDETTAAETALRARIVVADDNADMRDYVRRLVGSRWKVEAVANGVQALAAMRRQRPDLVITDVMMPELDGFGLAAAVRADESLRDVPILMLSARAGEEARLEGLQAGADDYLVKPFSARELLARVEMQLLRASIRSVEQLQRRQLTEVFRQAPAAIAILRGPEHVFELANPAYLALIGQRDVVGKPIRDALPELAGQGIFELLDRVFSSGEPHVGRALRLMVVRTAGNGPDECYFDFVYHPMRDATDEIDGIAVVAFEVSDLVRARRDAETANRTKDEFLAMLGHELRNPLAPMLTALQLMRLRGDSALERERVVIERQTRHLVRLVDDLLDVSRIARGKIELRVERVDLADVVAKAIEMASPLLEEREHDLRIDLPRGLLVDGDPARLAQVLANLLTNAAKYTEKGGLVSVRGERSDGEAAIVVRDSGIGIAPEMLPRVFEMFTQERQALDRTQGGLGLGLTIVRNLVGLHGGSVHARSAGRNRGSEFTVRLPLALGTDASAGAEPASRPLARPEGRGTSVLIVDDNEDAAAMLAEYVRSLGYRVRTAHDGPGAIRVAAEMSPDIALLDIGLPVMDGYELAARLREASPHSVQKLIAVTGYGQAADRARSQQAGFDAHLVKPVDLDILADLLESLAV